MTNGYKSTNVYFKGADQVTTTQTCRYNQANRLVIDLQHVMRISEIEVNLEIFHEPSGRFLKTSFVHTKQN